MKKKVFISFVIAKFICFGIMAQYPTGLIEDFNDENPIGWESIYSSDSIVELGGDMQVFIGESEQESIIDFIFDTINLKTNPYISLKVKSSKNYKVSLKIRDAHGLVSNKLGVHFIDSSMSGQYKTCYYSAKDFFYYREDNYPDSPLVEYLDSGKIKGVQVFVESIPEGAKDTGTVHIEDLRIGDQAEAPLIIGTSHVQSFETLVEDQIIVSSSDYDSAQFVDNTHEYYCTIDSMNHSWIYSVQAINVESVRRFSCKIKYTENCSFYANLYNSFGQVVGSIYKYLLSKDKYEWLTFDFDIFDFHVLGGYIGENIILQPDIQSIEFRYNFEKASGNAIITMDSLLIGDNVALPTPIDTGIVENFDDNVLSNKWSSQYQVDGLTPAHDFVIENQALKIIADRQEFEAMWYDNDLVNMSQYPYVSFKAKTNMSCIVRVNLYDFNGKFNLGWWDELDVEIGTSDEFQTYYLDYSGLMKEANNFEAIDSTRIDALLFNINPFGSYNDTLWIDDLKIGAKADKFFNLAPTIRKIIFPDTVYLSQDTVRIQINGVSSGDDISKVIDVYGISSQPKVASNPIISYNDGDTSTQFNIYPKKEGVVTFKIVVTDDGNKISNKEDDYYLEEYFSITVIDDVNSVSEEKNKRFTIYPNPADEFLNINITEEGSFKIEIVDLTGRILQSEEKANEGNHQIDISGLEKGMYVINVSNYHNSISKRIVIE